MSDCVNRATRKFGFNYLLRYLPHAYRESSRNLNLEAYVLKTYKYWTQIPMIFVIRTSTQITKAPMSA